MRSRVKQTPISLQYIKYKDRKFGTKRSLEAIGFSCQRTSYFANSGRLKLYMSEVIPAQLVDLQELYELILLLHKKSQGKIKKFEERLKTIGLYIDECGKVKELKLNKNKKGI